MAADVRAKRGHKSDPVWHEKFGVPAAIGTGRILRRKAFQPFVSNARFCSLVMSQAATGNGGHCGLGSGEIDVDPVGDFSIMRIGSDAERTMDADEHCHGRS